LAFGERGGRRWRRKGRVRREDIKQTRLQAYHVAFLFFEGKKREVKREKPS